MADNNIKMQHSSKSAAGFSHAGFQFESDEDGIISIPSHLASHATPHGFSTDVVVKEKKPLAKGAEGDKTGGKKAGKPDDKEGAEGDKTGDGK